LARRIVVIEEKMSSIEPIEPGHAEAVWPLSVEAGWNQNVADWRFMLAPAAALAAPDRRRLAGECADPAAGQKLAWISMVLVTRERRRGGSAPAG